MLELIVSSLVELIWETEALKVLCLHCTLYKLCFFHTLTKAYFHKPTIFYINLPYQWLLTVKICTIVELMFCKQKRNNPSITSSVTIRNTFTQIWVRIRTSHFFSSQLAHVSLKQTNYTLHNKIDLSRSTLKTWRK
jgi:hypothetical protein